jgi:hypothetical protein
VGWRALGRGYERGFIDLLLGMVGSLVCRLVDTPSSSIYRPEFPTFISSPLLLWWRHRQRWDTSQRFSICLNLYHHPIISLCPHYLSRNQELELNSPPHNTALQSGG